jgi:hypothetical protein
MSANLKLFHEVCDAYLKFVDEYPPQDFCNDRKRNDKHKEMEEHSKMFCDIVKTRKFDSQLILALQEFVVAKQEFFKDGIVIKENEKPAGGKIFEREALPVISISTERNTYEIDLSFWVFAISSKAKPMNSTKKEPEKFLVYLLYGLGTTLRNFVLLSDGIPKILKEKILFATEIEPATCPYSALDFDHLRNFTKAVSKSEKSRGIMTSIGVPKDILDNGPQLAENFDMNDIGDSNTSVAFIESFMKCDPDSMIDSAKDLGVKIVGSIQKASERGQDPTDQFDN